MCERCQGIHFTRVANLGVGLLMSCDDCKHHQIMRPQAPRGCLIREGIPRLVVEASGEVSI